MVSSLSRFGSIAKTRPLYLIWELELCYGWNRLRELVMRFGLLSLPWMIREWVAEEGQGA